MNKLTAGSFSLFRIAGIQVNVHWTWLLVAYFEIGSRVNNYQSMAWNVIEYVSIFGIVLLHEFGHALACRQVGGQANRIMLWPLGASPSFEASASAWRLLWSIAAGPTGQCGRRAPVTVAAAALAQVAGLKDTQPDFAHFLLSIAVINLVLLVFQSAADYPLDGGQILQALLWFVVGRARSLMISGILGLTARGRGMVVLAARLPAGHPGFAARGSLCCLAGVARLPDGHRPAKIAAHARSAQSRLFRRAAGATRRGGGAGYQGHRQGGEPGVVAAALTDRGIGESPACWRNWQGAIDDYREALRLQPKLVNAYNNLAMAARPPVPSTDFAMGQKPLNTRPGHATRPVGPARTIWQRWPPPACKRGRRLCPGYELAEACGSPTPPTAACMAKATVLARLRLYEQSLPYRLPVQGG